MNEEPNNIIAFPALEKCKECNGSGLVWSFDIRTKRQQAAAKCKVCNGFGKSRDTSVAVLFEQPPN